MTRCEKCGRSISAFGGSFKVDGKTVCSKCELKLRKEEEKRKQIIQNLKKEKPSAWKIIIKYVERYYINPFQEFNKLKKILDYKYNVLLEKDEFEKMLESDEIKKAIRNSHLREELSDFEDQLLNNKKKKLIKWKEIPDSKEKFETSSNNLTEKLEKVNKNMPNVITKDIEKLIDDGRRSEAEELLNKRLDDLKNFEVLSDELNKIKMKMNKLTTRLADGDISSSAYELANSDLERAEKNLKEQLWKLRNKLFKDDYEKPF